MVCLYSINFISILLNLGILNHFKMWQTSPNFGSQSTKTVLLLQVRFKSHAPVDPLLSLCAQVCVDTNGVGCFCRLVGPTIGPPRSLGIWVGRSMLLYRVMQPCLFRTALRSKSFRSAGPWHVRRHACRHVHRHTRNS